MGPPARASDITTTNDRTRTIDFCHPAFVGSSDSWNYEPVVGYSEVTHQSLFEELTVAAVGPGIVVLGELGAVLGAGVAIEPEFDEGAGSGVFEPGCA